MDSFITNRKAKYNERVQKNHLKDNKKNLTKIIHFK